MFVATFGLLDGSLHGQLQAKLLRSIQGIGGSNGWDHLDRPEQFTTCGYMLCALGSAWYRLVHKMDQPKFKLLCLGGRPFCAKMLSDFAGHWQARMDDCPDCVDASFTKMWLPSLRGPNAKSAHSFLQDCLATLPASSIVVEKKHLLGQEVGSRKARPICHCINTLSSDICQISQAEHATTAQES